ncbi:indole-3-glycerol phosphate synthase TrpC [Lacrimispora sp. AGF001]|uniref:indole-3-glycerol phosphate synthase TrpC n=1 Tax=Lacrimispora sp. AGF001 TaxID=3401631 RepID=UPI003B43A3B4
MILDTLAAASKQRAEAAKITIPVSQMEEMAYMAFEDGKRECDFSFEKAISSPGISFICEVKRASPSKGMIAPDFPYREIAMEYEEAGADAISVLTEPDYFLGKGEYLTEISQSVSLPLLRKDFTVDPYQIFEAKVLGASAVLLICALLDTEKLKEYMKICDSLGLSALVEAHDEAEIHSALTAGARLIGVNNRNLKTFEVDFENSIRLRGLVPAGTVFIAESGIQTADDVKRLYQAGVNGVLIGESLMRSPDKKVILQEMRKAANGIR